MHEALLHHAVEASNASEKRIFFVLGDDPEGPAGGPKRGTGSDDDYYRPEEHRQNREGEEEKGETTHRPPKKTMDFIGIPDQPLQLPVGVAEEPRKRYQGFASLAEVVAKLPPTGLVTWLVWGAGILKFEVGWLAGRGLARF